MANSMYGSVPEGFGQHDKLLLETQVALLNKVRDASSSSYAKAFAEAYALISGHITAQAVEIKNG